MGSPGFAFYKRFSSEIQLASAAFLLHQHPRNQLGLAGLAAQMAEKQLGSLTADVVLHVREGSDSRAGHFTVRAVVKTDHGDISGTGHAGSVQIRDNHGGNLIVVADDGAAAGEKLRSARVFITAAQEAFLLVGAVPENVFVLNGEIKALQRIHIAGKTLPALQVVVFEDTGNLSVALSVQILRQHA